MIGNSDNAECYHSLDLILRLGLAGATGEAQDGKDVADHFIGTKKRLVIQCVKHSNDAVPADDWCQKLSEMKKLLGSTNFCSSTNTS